jgi:regulator of protease activity HflC (stomatin/prohibitin superfamily)
LNNKNNNSSPKWPLALAGCGGCLVIVLCIGLLLLSAVREIFIFVEPIESVIVISPYEPTGFRSEALSPGLHFLYPGERAFSIDLRHQTYLMSNNPDVPAQSDFMEATTSDGQKIQVDISITYRVNPEQVLSLYKTWRDGYRDGVVRPMSRGATREVLAQYTFDEALLKRDEIKKVIFDKLAPTLAENYLILLAVEIFEIRHANK